jgi:hypothetical protein
MDTYAINEYLLKLIQETSKELLRIYFDKSNRRTHLKFPRYRKGEVRVSEQELRFALTNIHEQFTPHPDIYYSVETPTEEEYSFSGNDKRSAASDLSFYYNNKKVLNIELKAHNADQKAINKDIEKLVRENCNGAWIHVFKNEDSRTVRALFEKFEKAFNKYKPSKKPISFHILILETKTLLSRKGKENEINYSKESFNINYDSWSKLKNQPGRYRFFNGNQITENCSEEDWQIDMFDI